MIRKFKIGDKVILDSNNYTIYNELTQRWDVVHILRAEITSYSYGGNRYVISGTEFNYNVSKNDIRIDNSYFREERLKKLLDTEDSK